MRILVTGGAGFIGSHLVDRLLKRPDVDYLTVVDNLSYASSRNNLNPNATFAHADIANPAVMSRIVERHDVVINVAAESHVDRSIHDSKPFIHSNIVGTHTLIEHCLTFGRAFIQVSTDEVYGEIEAGEWGVDAPIAPRSPYAASKAAADILVQSYIHTYGLNAYITRGCNTYGPRQYPEKLLPVCIRAAEAGLPFPIYGNGRNVREWMYVDDHARGIEAVLEHAMFVPPAFDYDRVFHLGTGARMDNNAMMVSLASVMGIPNHPVTYVADRKGHDSRYALDSSLTALALGWSAQTPLGKGLAETVDWYKNVKADYWSCG